MREKGHNHTANYTTPQRPVKVQFDHMTWPIWSHDQLKKSVARIYIYIIYIYHRYTHTHNHLHISTYTESIAHDNTCRKTEVGYDNFIGAVVVWVTRRDSPDLDALAELSCLAVVCSTSMGPWSTGPGGTVSRKSHMRMVSSWELLTIWKSSNCNRNTLPVCSCVCVCVCVCVRERERERERERWESLVAFAYRNVQTWAATC